jgi:two-component sensor histidine kinase
MSSARKFLYLFGFLPVIFITGCYHNAKNEPLPATTYTTADTATVTALLKKASSFSQANFDSLFYYSSQAFALSAKINYAKGKAKSLSYQANAQRRKGNYAEAVSLNLRSTAIWDSLQASHERISEQTSLADIYKEMGGEKGTIEFLQKGLDLSHQSYVEAAAVNDYDEMINALNEQGIIYRDLSKRNHQPQLFDTAFQLYEQAIHIIDQTGKGKQALGKLYNNISQVYNEHYNDYPKALEYLFKAVAFNKERNSPISLSYNYGNIADVYAHTGDFARAKYYAREMLTVSTEMNAPHRQVNAYNQLMRIAKTLKEYDSALQFKEQSVYLADSLNNVEKTGQIADMQTKYETKLKESQISELSHSNNVKSQRLLLIALAAGVLALMLGLVWMQTRKLKKQKEQIIEQSERLKWLMKELHHRVKNNLQIVSSLLNLQTYRLKDEESVAALRESQLRVQAMSLIHQRLYQVEEVTLVNFKLYITDLTETLMRAYGFNTDSFDLRLDIEKEFLDVDTVMPLGLLVNELITNSFKYAYGDVKRPELTISLEQGSSQLRLSVSDNGPGMSVADTKKGFGKQLITALTKQLKANCEVNVTQGTSYLFTIPYTKEKAA